MQTEHQFQCRIGIDALGDAADEAAKLIGSKRLFRIARNDDGLPWKQLLQHFSGNSEVSHEDQHHQVGRISGVFRAQILR